MFCEEHGYTDEVGGACPDCVALSDYHEPTESPARIVSVSPFFEGYKVIATIDGKRVEMHTSKSGRVGWSSDWGAVSDLVEAGVLTSRYCGPSTWGHVDIHAHLEGNA